MRKLVWAMVLGLAAGAIGTAQDIQMQQVQRRASADAPAKPKPLTKEEQLRVKQLLESAEAGAAGLDAASKVVSYAELAHAYQLNDKKKAVELLELALPACRDIQLESADKRLNDQIKHQLQMRIVRDFANLAPERLDQLIEQLVPEMRSLAIEPMIQYYGKANRLDRAMEVVMQAAQEDEMPYGPAANLMSLLGRNRSDEVRSLFVSSLASYQNHDHSAGFRSRSDFPDMITKVQDQLPPGLLRQAVDEVLAQAKKIDEQQGGFNVSVASSKGAASFQSAYDYRLFQLLTTLRKIDPERAEKLVKESQDVSTLSAKYPEGMNTFSGTDGQPGGGMTMSVGMGKPPASRPGGPAGPSALERQQMAQISEDAAKHPQDAIANAARLSPSIAVDAYIQIAHVAQKDNPSASSAALEKASQLIDGVPLTQQMVNMQAISSTYLKLGEIEKAKSSLEQSLSVAKRLYEKDIDADDPNQAPTAYWASTNGYRSVLGNAVKVDPAWAMNLLKQIPDDSIRVFNQIAMANAMAGSPSQGFQIISAFKDGGTQMMFSRED
jgi:tetratricopeptide (TPR) repeat protein